MRCRIPQEQVKIDPDSEKPPSLRTFLGMQNDLRRNKRIPHVLIFHMPEFEK